MAVEWFRSWHGAPTDIKWLALAKMADRVELPVLMAGLHKYVSKQDDRRWCNPSTWLNQDRWEDQPAVALSRSPQLQKPSIADVAGLLMRQMDNYDE